MRIAVIGAGYAGTRCAVRLALRTRGQDASITLVNGSDRFVERLRMHQVAAGQELVSHRVPDILEGTDVTFVEGMVVGIDTATRTPTPRSRGSGIPAPADLAGVRSRVRGRVRRRT